jgi:hypothetical protein
MHQLIFSHISFSHQQNKAGKSAAFLMYLKHSVLTWVLLQKSIHATFLLTTEDGLFMITADDLAANALERFDDGVDDNNWVDVTFNDAVDAWAYNATSGITTSGTSIGFANFALRTKQTLQDSASSVNLPDSFLRFARVLGMIAVE